MPFFNTSLTNNRFLISTLVFDFKNHTELEIVEHLKSGNIASLEKIFMLKHY